MIAMYYSHYILVAEIWNAFLKESKALHFLTHKLVWVLSLSLISFKFMFQLYIQGVGQIIYVPSFTYGVLYVEASYTGMQDNSRNIFYPE